MELALSVHVGEGELEFSSEGDNKLIATPHRESESENEPEIKDKDEHSRGESTVTGSIDKNALMTGLV